MTANEPSQKAMIQAALADLDALARAEYGDSLEALLLSKNPKSELRVQRLVGIALKRKFANPTPRVPGEPRSGTDARRSWPWPDMGDSLVPIESDAAKDLELLENLRKPGVWNEPKRNSITPDDGVPIPWRTFKDDVESERGLFKILALYATDKFNRQEARTLKAYLEASETKRFEAGLNLATLLFDAGVVTPLAGVLGIPTLAVGVALVGVQYGYRMLTDPNVGRAGDSYS